MGYFKSYNTEKKINEDVGTGIYNVFTRLIQGQSNVSDDLNLQRNMPLAGIPFGLPSFVKFRDLHRNDKQRFRILYKITNEVKSKLAKLCKQQGGWLFTDRSARQFKSEFERSPEKFYLNSAGRDLGNGLITTLTVDMQVSYKQGFFVVYFTFDNSKIYDIQVITKNGLKKLSGIDKLGISKNKRLY